MSQPVAASQLTNWISILAQKAENKALIKAEIELRHAMNSFVQEYPLVVGDVVTVPKLVPHALQHGVRVVEFQTPVYERKILSFAQKVLTQPHWDTEEALELVDLDAAGLQLPELMSVAPQLRIERIVNFDDFEVQRIQLEGRYTVNKDVYCILMVLYGGLTLSCADDRRIAFDSGQAVLLPKMAKGWLVESRAPCLFLLALPRQSA